MGWSVYGHYFIIQQGSAGMNIQQAGLYCGCCATWARQWEEGKGFSLIFHARSLIYLLLGGDIGSQPLPTQWTQNYRRCLSALSNNFIQLCEYPCIYIVGVFNPVILHPNVFPSGKVSLSLIDKNKGWKPQITTKEVHCDLKVEDKYSLW